MAVILPNIFPYRPLGKIRGGKIRGGKNKGRKSSPAARQEFRGSAEIKIRGGKIRGGKK